MAGKTDQKAMMAKIIADRRKKEDKEGWWKPPAGKYWIRIMPPWDGSSSWYIEYYVHYRIIPNVEQGESSALLCLKRSFGKPCYACEVCDELWLVYRAAAQNTPERDAAYKDASEVSPKYRMACNVVVLSDPKKVLRWSAGDNVKNQLAGISVPETEEGQESVYVPIEDPDRGFSLFAQVKSVRNPKNNAQYNEFVIQLPQGAQPKPVPDKSVLTKLYNLDEWLKTQIKSYDEQRAQLGGGSDPTKTEGDAPSEEVAPVEEATEPEVQGVAEELPPEIAEELPPEVVEVEEPVAAPAPKVAPKPAPVVKAPVAAPKPAPVVAPTGGTNARPTPADANAKTRAILIAHKNKFAAK